MTVFMNVLMSVFMSIFMSMFVSVSMIQPNTYLIIFKTTHS